MLFKAGLQYLAASIDRVESYDMLPVLSNGSPVDLFEKKGFTMKLLRMLDNEWGIYDLLDEESRQVAAELIKDFLKFLVDIVRLLVHNGNTSKLVIRGNLLFKKRYINSSDLERLKYYMKTM